MKLSHELLDSRVSGPRASLIVAGRDQANTLNSELCEIYDVLIEEGMSQNEAIRQTRAILKAINYRCITYDTVITRLRSSGRFRKHSGGKVTGGAVG